MQTVKKSRSGDPFKIAKKVLKAPGPFITMRAICRRAHALNDTVVTAMEKLEKESLGKINHELKCFFKTMPLTVMEESLQLYDMDIVEYSQAFRRSDRSLSPNQWDFFMNNAPDRASLAQYFPNDEDMVQI